MRTPQETAELASSVSEDIEFVAAREVILAKSELWHCWLSSPTIQRLATKLADCADTIKHQELVIRGANEHLDELEAENEQLKRELAALKPKPKSPDDVVSSFTVGPITRTVEISRDGRWRYVGDFCWTNGVGWSQELARLAALVEAKSSG